MSKYRAASQGDIELEKALMGLDADGLPITTGNKYYVIPSGDSNYDEFYDKYQTTYKDGTQAVHNTIASAYSAVTSNRHDVIYISANAAHAQSSMLDISKNRVHFVGMSMRGGSLGMGARTRITMGVTTAATDLGVMQNTGVGNTFDNLKFDSSNTKAESLYSVVEAGEYSIYRSCEFYKSTDLDVTGAAELAMNGDSAQFIDCYIGSTANETSGAIIRPNVLLTGGIVSGKKCRDAIFKGCTLARKSGHADNNFVYGANATDVERMLQFQNCVFFNNPLSAATPDVAVEMGAAQTEGAIFIDQNSAGVDVGVVGATGQNIFVVSQDGSTYATAGLAVAS